MKKWLLLSLALLAAYMAARALRRQPDTVTLLWALIGLTATASTPNTPKARAVEDRLNGVVAAVGTVNGTATAAASAASTAQGSANTAQALANNAQGAANNANANAGNRVAKTGDTMSGPLTVNDQVNCNSLNVNGNATDNGHTTHGNLNVDNQVTASIVVATSLFTVSGQRIAPGQGTAGGYPIAHGTPFNNGVIDVINQTINGLRAAGILV